MTSVAPSIARLADWSSLSGPGRTAALEQCRRRLAHIGRMLHAVEHIYPAEAARQGPLAGLPYVAKDMFATGRSRPSWGCSTPQAPALPRASVIDRLDQAGASLIGTATMTELACEPSGFTRRGALNPWSFDCIPGGSSTGSAILVASGCCFAALGSDTGGSVRMPAHCCGVTALKSGYGKIPLDGAMAPRAEPRHASESFARSAADLALLWPVISGEPLAASEKLPRAVVLRDAFDSSDAEIAAIVRGAIGVLAESGHDDRGAIWISRRGRPACLDRPASGASPRTPPSVSMIQPPTSRCASVSARDSQFRIKISPRHLAARDALRDQFILSCSWRGRRRRAAGDADPNASGK